MESHKSIAYPKPVPKPVVPKSQSQTWCVLKPEERKTCDKTVKDMRSNWIDRMMWGEKT